MNAHLILTVDYEVFGNGQGCLKHCVVEPASRLLRVADQFDAPVTLFAEAAELMAMEREMGRGAVRDVTRTARGRSARGARRAVASAPAMARGEAMRRREMGVGPRPLAHRRSARGGNRKPDLDRKRVARRRGLRQDAGPQLHGVSRRQLVYSAVGSRRSILATTGLQGGIDGRPWNEAVGPRRMERLPVRTRPAVLACGRRCV